MSDCGDPEQDAAREHEQWEAYFAAGGSNLDLHDMIEQPDFNWETQNNRGEWSLRDVSSGCVFPGEDGKPRCIDHGAMNCVVPDKTIWRCLMCGRAAYVK